MPGTFLQSVATTRETGLALSGRSDLQLIVGVGAKSPGWLSIADDPAADLALELRLGIPADDRSVAVLWVAGLLDAPRTPAAQVVAAEASRVLRTGGLMRIIGPSPRVAVPPRTVALGSALPEAPAWWAAIAQLLAAAGFVELRPSRWGASLLASVRDLESTAAPGSITVTDAFR